MSEPRDPLIGTAVLDRYRIVRRLARGGMGALYLARTEGAEGFTRPVVAKFVLPSLTQDSEVSALAVREAHLLSNLQHPNVVSVLDLGQQPDGGYVTLLEYVNGYSLAEWMRFLKTRGERMPFDAAVYIVLRVLDALQYAHTFEQVDGTALKIVHRDVAPSNILLSDRGSVKLLDFGIAQSRSDRVDNQKQRPRIRGQLAYLPLEVFQGSPASVQSDIYAAGLVLYEALTGANPFAGRDATEVFKKVSSVTPPSIHASRDDAPEAIDVVLARALKRDPKRRYGSAAELSAALQALLDKPQEGIGKQLAEQLYVHFQGALPQALGVEPLSVRESAWRNFEPARLATDAAITDPAPAPEQPAQRFSIAPHEAVTVAVDINPELLAAERLQNPRPSVAPHPSTPRIAWIAGVSSLLGAGVAVLAWTLIARDSGPQPVVVVEPPKAIAVPAPHPAPAPKVASPAAPAIDSPQPSPSETAEEAVVQAAAASEPALPKPEKPDPRPPNPAALTRVFGRRQKHIEACFDRHAAGLQGQPELALHFRVATDGRVAEARLTPSALEDTALGHCLLQVATSTAFEPQQRELSFHIPIVAQAKP